MARWEPSMCLIYCSTCGDLLPTWSVCCLCKLVSHAGSRQSHDSVLLEKWSDMKWHPSMVTHTQNVCSSFNPSKCTHTVNTHPEQWAANAAAPGDQLGVRCLAQGSHLSRGIGGGESTSYLLHWQYLQEMRLSTTPTLYTLGRDCPAPHTVNTHPACDAQTHDLQIMRLTRCLTAPTTLVRWINYWGE